MSDKIQYSSEQDLRNYYESLTRIINDYLHYHRDNKRLIARTEIIEMIRNANMDHLKILLDMTLSKIGQDCFDTIHNELGIKE